MALVKVTVTCPCCKVTHEEYDPKQYNDREKYLAYWNFPFEGLEAEKAWKQKQEMTQREEFALWAKRFLRQVCSFPEAGGHDDYVDSLSQALRVLRDSGWITLDPLPARDYDYADDYQKKFVNPYSQ